MLLIKTEKYPRKQISKQWRAKFKQALTKNAESPAIQSCMQGFICCGENEIRTRDTLLAYTRFPGVPLQPLEHLSFRVSGGKSNGYF